MGLWKEISDSISLQNNSDVIEEIKGQLQEKSPKMYKEWMEVGFDINYQFIVTREYLLPVRTTLLHAAALGSRLEVFKAVLDKGFDLHSQSSEHGGTPLHAAASGGCLEIAEFLLGKGINVDSQNDFGHTPLWFAAGQGHLEMARFLLDKGALLGNDDRDSALCVAARMGHVGMVEFLLDRGADIKLLSDNKEILSTAKKGNLEMVKLLLNRGIDVNWSGRDGKDILYASVYGGNINLVKFLLNMGADIKSLSDGDKVTLFCHAVEEDYLEVARFLLENGVDVNTEGVVDCNGEKIGSALCMPAARGNSKMVELLLDRGIDINLSLARAKSSVNNPLSRARRKFSPYLEVSVLFDHVEIAKLLLDGGADLDLICSSLDHFSSQVAELVVDQAAKLEAAGLFVSEKVKSKITSDERYKNHYLQRLEVYKEEVKKLERGNEQLCSFLKESDTNKLVDIWEANKSMRSKFNNKESLKIQYPEYASILINKANEVKKEIFLHNHKYFISVLSVLYRRDLLTMALVGMEDFLKAHRDDIVIDKRVEIEGQLYF